MTKDEMLRVQRAHDAANMFAIGFTQKGNLYTILSDTMPDECLRETEASSKRGGMKRLRVYLRSAYRKLMIATGKAILEGKAELLDNGEKNEGLAYEKFFTERYTGKTWIRDDSPFWVKGDCEWNGLQVQVKFQGGTFADEATLIGLVG